MKRVGFVVDGLNLYHAIQRRPDWHGYKWLNLNALAKAYLKSSTEELLEVCFCTSSPTWNINKLNRHQALLSVYADLGIRVLKGEIRETKGKCKATCGLEFLDHEEKQTDINVAIEVLKFGLDPNCHKVFLVTADSDQIPTVTFFRQRFPDKELIVLLPPGEFGVSLSSLASGVARIKAEQLGRSLITEPYTMRNGTVVQKPTSWFHKTVPPARA